MHVNTTPLQALKTPQLAHTFSVHISHTILGVQKNYFSEHINKLVFVTETTAAAVTAAAATATTITTTNNNHNNNNNGVLGGAVG
jgi:hypothetical protein